MSAEPDQSASSREYVLHLREELEAARNALRQNHGKLPGQQLAHLYSFAVEQLLVRHLEATADRLGLQRLKSTLSVLAVGGFGRIELGLHSDLDFVIITETEPTGEQADLIRGIVQPLWDLRMDIGHGVHTVREAVGMLGSDITKVTALLSLRHVWGSEELSEELRDRLEMKLHKHHKLWFVNELLQEIRGRHSRYGDTVFLLEPDIKLSRGGLRDVHQILWIAFASYGVLSLETLVEHGVITHQEEFELRQAWSFLISLRNSLHIHANRRQDKLSLEGQVHVAPMMGFHGTDFVLPEEELMRTYYEHALLVERISQRLLRQILEETPGTPENSLLTEKPREVDRDFWARGDEIWFEEKTLPQIESDRFWQMRFFLAAARERLQPREDALRRIEERLESVDAQYRRELIPRDCFFQILRLPGAMEQTLRAMHHCGFLGAWLPNYATIRNLPRRDHWHIFTVDEHSLRTVGIMESLLSDDPPPEMEHVAEVARLILRLDLLAFALLLHDVGKGEGRGHVIRGMHIAQRECERMNLRPIEADIVRRLVANHQKMSQMALQRDIDDPGVGVELAQAVETPEQLRMLYVHTACDMKAVSHDSWNEWRSKLLAVLYDRTLDALCGRKETRPLRRPIGDLRERIWQELKSNPKAQKYTRGDLDHFFSDMPDLYLASVPEWDAATHFLLSTELSDEKRITFTLERHEGSEFHDLTFVARTAPGLFANLCQALASKRLNILSAQVYTANSGEAVDIFQVHVPDVLIDRIEDNLNRMVDRLNAMLQKGRYPDWSGVVDKTTVLVTEDRLRRWPPKIEVNNDMSPTHTVVKVGAPDRPGFLSEIAGVFDQFGVNLDRAFVATEGFHVVDTFYVTDLETSKITNQGKIDALIDGLIKMILSPYGLTREDLEVEVS